MSKLDEQAKKYEFSVTSILAILGNQIQPSLSGAYKAGFKSAVLMMCKFLKRRRLLDDNGLKALCKTLLEE